MMSWADGDNVTSTNLNAKSGLFVSVKDEDFGAVGDGVTDDTVAIQAAINAGIGRVFFPDGRYMVSATIDLKTGVLLEGTSSRLGSNPGVTIDGTNISSGPILRVTGGVTNFLHNAGIMRLSLENGPQDGLFVDRNGAGGGVGETFFIDQVQSNKNGRDGLRFEGDSTPLHIGRISVHNNGGSGLFLGTVPAHVQVIYVSGDNNAVALVEMDPVNTFSNIHIVGWKSERNTTGIGPGHPDIFKLANCSGGYVHIGPGRYTSQDAAAPNALVNISGSSLRIDIDPISAGPSLTADYTHGVQNQIISKNVTPADLIKKRYSTVKTLFYPRSVAGESPSFLWNAAVAVGAVDPGDTIRFNHSDDGATTDCTVEFYNGTTLKFTIDTAGNIVLVGGKVTLTATTVQSGSGSPETVVSAPVGSMFFRTDGGANTTLYVKESGSGNTGWVAK